VVRWLSCWGGIGISVFGIYRWTALMMIKCPKCGDYEEQEIIDSFGECAFCDKLSGDLIDGSGYYKDGLISQQDEETNNEH